VLSHAIEADQFHNVRSWQSEEPQHPKESDMNVLAKITESLFPQRPARRDRKNNPRLQLESLEDRVVPAVTLQQSGSTLYITGDARSDTVQLYELPYNYYSTIADRLIVSWRDDWGRSGSGNYLAPALSKIVFQGNAGNDVFANVFNPGGAQVFACPYSLYGIAQSMLPVIEGHGGAGHDQITGGPRNDHLYGDAGNDTLNGGYGNDRYAFDNKVVGGGSLGTDTINEAANNGTDRLDFFSHMNRAVNVNLGTTATQNVNQFLNLKLANASAIENVSGTYYDDVIRGNALNNYIYGSDGNDTLYGMAGNDTLDGGWYNDALYGGDGHDTLYGGGGNDGLFGGMGVDTLYGQSGADRFLVQEYIKFDPYTPPQNQDIIKDQASADATILFKHETKYWSAAEIERLDAAFAILHQATDNTRLLKLSNGAQLSFGRMAGTGRGWNHDGYITLSDAQLNGSTTWEIGYVLHEIGHNWDTESSIWSNFLNLSGWTKTNPNSSAYTKVITEGSPKETWWFKTNSAFASNYAKRGPREDLAESFAAYFLQKAGLYWYSNDGLGASAIPAKINLIDGWVKSL
jgi:hypothetical protein